MNRRPRQLAFLMALTAILGSSALLRAQSSFEPKPYKCAGRCARIANAFIRADIGPNGTWVVGTTGGDPDSPADDDKNLLFGFKPGGDSSVGTGYTSLRIVGDQGPYDTFRLEPSPQVTEPERIATVWDWDRPAHPYRLRVTQTLSLRENTYSGRPDLVGIRYQVENRDDQPLDVGLRSLLDIKLGINDGAPYFIPGVGAVVQEQDFEGEDVPPYWLAFESPVYDARELRSIGVLRDADLTAPDRFVVARWSSLLLSPWAYSVDSTQVVTKDSAVALYWLPTRLEPGQRLERSTAYGLSGNRGGSAFLSAKVLASCGEEIDVAIFVSNADSQSLTGGQARLDPPTGWRFAAGSQALQPIGDIPPGESGSVVWRLRVPDGASGRFTLSARADFDGGRSYEAGTEVEIECLPTATPRPSATPSPTPESSASPTPAAADACALILNRVPPAAISAALANPEAVFGWMQPANPGLPPGPNNPPRRWLSLRDIGKAYHPLFNPLIFKVGCP